MPAPDGGGPAISDGTTTDLAAQGADGAALAQALGGDPAQSGKKPRGRAQRGGKAGSALTPAVVPEPPSSNPFSAVTRAAGGDTTLGSSFFLALFGVVVLMLGFAWVGYRRSTSA